MSVRLRFWLVAPDHDPANDVQSLRGGQPPAQVHGEWFAG